MCPNFFMKVDKRHLLNFNTTLPLLKISTKESKLCKSAYGLFDVILITILRLWHQLTTKILEFFEEPESAPFQLSIFQNFVAEWEDKINKLSLVSIALQAARQSTGIFYYYTVEQQENV